MSSRSQLLHNLYIAAAYVSLFVLGLADNIRGPVLPDLQHDLGLNDFEGSWFFTVASLAGWLCTATARLWLLRWHPYWALVIWTALQSVGLLLLGQSASYVALLTGSVFLGGSMGSQGVVQNILVGWGTESRRARQRQTYAGLHTMYGLAALLAPLLVTALYGANLNWSYVFLTVAGVSSFLTLWLIYAGRRGLPTASVQLPSIWQERRWRQAIPVGLILAGYVASELMISTRLVLYLRRDLGWDVASANSLLTVFFVGMCAGRLFFALVPLSSSSRWLLARSALASSFTGLAGLWWHPLFFAFTGLSMSVFFPCLMAFLREEYPDMADYMVAFAMTCSPLAIMLMHVCIGAISSVSGLQIALSLGPLLCFGLFLLLYTGPFRQKLR